MKIHLSLVSLSLCTQVGPTRALVAMSADGQATPVVLEIFPSGVQVPRAGFTPDGSTVLFLSDEALPDRFELSAVPADGSTPPLRVSAPLGAVGGVVFDEDESLPAFKVTPDGSTVVYRADTRTAGVDELWASPLAGGGPAQLVSDPALGVDVGPDFQLLADSERILFRAFVQPFHTPSSKLDSTAAVPTAYAAAPSVVTRRGSKKASRSPETSAASSTSLTKTRTASLSSTPSHCGTSTSSRRPFDSRPEGNP